MTDLAELLQAADRIVAFTGAGISTESGIPDFRSPGGVWTRYDPREFTFDRYVESADVRRKSWAMREELFAHRPAPNAAHRALARLEEAGRLSAVVTQNIDGLHQDAGSRTVIEIHGTMREVECIGLRPAYGTPDGCGFRQGTEWVFARLAAGEDDPRCPECGGIIKSATISFGQMMPAQAMDDAVQQAQDADLLLTIGSSLQVYPAADIPLIAKDAGARLAIVNREPTPLDGFADVVVHGSAGEILGAAVVS
ncbi:SIR2 family NAD-dependent protein deacylase [Cumulibacter manganitolerans]|uniref:SIR2 family NAD-dependent protein deacylase n=1 Tax=Cumulibacter manganitolerans TaxID=1884992 RepID=UPI001295876E|nr:Sir2 family NAD-dependent protein deacetylase [Cumulibacter manganitolerans]